MNLLVISSTIFILPTIISVYNKLWLEFSACIYITIISSIHHYIRNNITSILDKLGCYYLTYVCYVSAKRVNKLYIWAFAAIYSLCVYNIAYFFNILAWNPDINIALMWHISMHLVVALSFSFNLYFQK